MARLSSFWVEMSESFITRPSLSLHADKGLSIYQSGNKYENYENQITNSGNSTVFHSKKLSKSRRLIYFWQKMIISFFMIFLLIFSSVMKLMKITKFHEKTKVCQNHEGSCYYYHTFWNPEKLPFSSTEKNYQNLALLEWGIGGLKKRGAKPASDGGGGGYSISYIPWESQLSGEVSSYPQALLKVVNLQGMLDFHRNFHRSKNQKQKS